MEMHIEILLFKILKDQLSAQYNKTFDKAISMHFFRIL